MAQQYLSIAVDLWAERDRVQIYITHAYWGDEIACWRDEEVHELFESGYLKGSFIPGPLGTHTADRPLLERIYGVLALRGKAPEYFECGNCGGNGLYVSSYCNAGHCATCGCSVDEDHAECYINPRALHYEVHAKDGELDAMEFKALMLSEPVDDDFCDHCKKEFYFD